MQQREKLLTRIETNEAIVGVRTDGIIHVYYKSGVVLDVPLQLKMLKIFNEITKNQDKPFIWEAGNNVRLTREARLNAAAMEKNTPVLASVVVVKNWYQRIVAEFYYKINKPGMIYKVTTNFATGIDWLHQVKVDAVA